MRLAIISDIHANFVALQAVTAHIETWQPDMVVVAGDIVNRGPQPVPCFDYVRHKQAKRAWILIRGNHEDYVCNQGQGDTYPSQQRSFNSEIDLQRHALWTYQQLAWRIKLLSIWPDQTTIFVQGQIIRVVHASMQHNRDGIFPDVSADHLRRQISPAPDVICVGHTHRPFKRYLDQTLVINAGSVGLPFDGDTRPSYARLELRKGKWKAEIVRVDYDRQAARLAFHNPSFIDGSGAIAHLIIDEFENARSHLFRWSQHYYRDVVEGRLTITEAVELYLQQQT